MGNDQPVEFDPEQIRELYAAFGLAVYQGQCVERQLAILLATEYGLGIQRMTRKQFEELLESLFDKTLGALITRLRGATAIADDLEFTLREALNKRNWLVHDYFWDRSGHVLTEGGRELMIHELREIAASLDLLDKDLARISRAWGERHGISEEVLQEQLEELRRRV